MKIVPFLPELFRHLFKKPATVKYPFEKLQVPPGFRGSPYLLTEKCIACRACERDCPAEAIEITSVSQAEKTYKMLIHNDRCVHCAQCVESCPTDAMQINSEFEIAAFSRHKLKVEYNYTRSTEKPHPIDTKRYF